MKEASSSGAKSVTKTTHIVKKKVTSIKVKSESKGKKVFTLPGQKHEAPEERDPLRIFYETLHEQRPDSEMAGIWMMEHGLLDAGDAKRVLERKQKRQHQEKNGIPMKSSSHSRESSKVMSKTAVSKTSLSNGKSQHQEKNGNSMKAKTHSKEISKVTKVSVSNGKCGKPSEQKGKRKHVDQSSDDEDFISRPTKRKFKS